MLSLAALLEKLDGPREIALSNVKPTGGEAREHQLKGIFRRGSVGQPDLPIAKLRGELTQLGKAPDEPDAREDRKKSGLGTLTANGREQAFVFAVWRRRHRGNQVHREQIRSGAVVPSRVRDLTKAQPGLHLKRDVPQRGGDFQRPLPYHERKIVLADRPMMLPQIVA